MTGAASFPNRLDALLQNFSRSVPGVRAVAIGDANGLPVVSLLGPKSLAATAMATMALSVAQRVSSSLDLAGSSDVIIVGTDWKVFVRAIDFDLTFIGVLGSDADLAAIESSFETLRGEVRTIFRDFGMAQPARARR